MALVTSTSEEGRLDLRLERAARACGCPEGAAAGLAGIAIYGVLVVWPSLGLGVGPTALRVLGALPVLIVFGAVGKVAGQRAGAWRAGRIRKQLDELRRSTTEVE